MQYDNNKPIVLEIKGLGNVPAFKNNKMLARGRLITNPERQKWMKKAIQSIASQLRCGSMTTGTGTPTGQLQRCLTVSWPLDDRWQWIPDLHVTACKVHKGYAGATISIERIS